MWSVVWLDTASERLRHSNPVSVWSTSLNVFLFRGPSVLAKKVKMDTLKSFGAVLSSSVTDKFLEKPKHVVQNKTEVLASLNFFSPSFSPDMCSRNLPSLVLFLHFLYSQGRAYRVGCLSLWGSNSLNALARLHWPVTDHYVLLLLPPTVIRRKAVWRECVGEHEGYPDRTQTRCFTGIPQALQLHLGRKQTWYDCNTNLMFFPLHNFTCCSILHFNIHFVLLSIQNVSVPFCSQFS